MRARSYRARAGLADKPLTGERSGPLPFPLIRSGASRDEDLSTLAGVGSKAGRGLLHDGGVWLCRGQRGGLRRRSLCAVPLEACLVARSRLVSSRHSKDATRLRCCLCHAARLRLRRREIGIPQRPLGWRRARCQRPSGPWRPLPAPPRRPLPPRRQNRGETGLGGNSSAAQGAGRGRPEFRGGTPVAPLLEPGGGRFLPLLLLIIIITTTSHHNK